MVNSSKGHSLTNVTINPNGSITHRVRNPDKTFTTITYNPNLSVRHTGTPNTSRPKNSTGKPPPPINAQEVRVLTAQEERAERKAAQRKLNRNPSNRIRGGSRTRKRRYF